MLPILGRLHAMNSDVDLGRKMVVRAETLLRERARARRPLSLVRKRRAEVELLGVDLDAAEAYLRQAVELDMAMDIREEPRPQPCLRGSCSREADMKRLEMWPS